MSPWFGSGVSVPQDSTLSLPSMIPSEFAKMLFSATVPVEELSTSRPATHAYWLAVVLVTVVPVAPWSHTARRYAAEALPARTVPVDPPSTTAPFWVEKPGLL